MFLVENLPQPGEFERLSIGGLPAMVEWHQIEVNTDGEIDTISRNFSVTTPSATKNYWYTMVYDDDNNGFGFQVYLSGFFIKTFFDESEMVEYIALFQELLFMRDQRERARKAKEWRVFSIFVAVLLFISLSLCSVWFYLQYLSDMLIQ